MTGILTYSPADVIRALLIDLGLGTAPSDGDGWPVYVAQEPDSPDSVITVKDTSPILNGRVMTDGEVQEHPGVLIRVRNANPVDGYAKSQEIAVALDKSVNLETVSVGDETYTVYAVSRRGGVHSLGKDVLRTKLNLFTINVVVSLRQIA